MRNWLTLLTTVFVGSTLSLSGMEARSYVDFQADYRHDSASWKFIVPSPDPILESNVRFKDVHIFQIGVNAKTTLDCNMMVRAHASYGWILDGDADSSLKAFGPVDTIGGAEIINELEAKHVLDGRYVADLSVAIGYPFYFCDCTVSFSPTVGYSYSTQHYRVERNDRIFATAPTTPNLIPVLETDSDSCGKDTFTNKWYGPFIGFDIGYNPCDCLSLYAQFEYHLAHFSGRRDSNVGLEAIDDFDSPTHHAHGCLVSVGAVYDFCDCWFLGLDVTYQDWRAHKSGSLDDELVKKGYKTEEECCDHLRTEVNLHSIAVGVVVGRVF